MNRLLVPILAVPLVSCLFGSDDPEYPPISNAALAGCWTRKQIFEGTCEERCFTQGGGKYNIQLTGLDKPGLPTVVEGFGSYTLKGNYFKYSGKVGNTANPKDTATFSGELTYTIIRDTLYSITSGGRVGFAKSDSANNCRPHWRVFTKPSDWDQ